MRHINIHKTRMTTTLKSEAIRSEFDYRDALHIILYVLRLTKLFFKNIIFNFLFSYPQKAVYNTMR